MNEACKECGCPNEEWMLKCPHFIQKNMQTKMIERQGKSALSIKFYKELQKKKMLYAKTFGKMSIEELESIIYSNQLSEEQKIYIHGIIFKKVVDVTSDFSTLIAVIIAAKCLEEVVNKT